MAEPDRAADSFVRLPEVIRRTGLSKPTIYRKMAAGKFPKCKPLSANVVAWYESDLRRWIASPMEWEDQPEAA